MNTENTTQTQRLPVIANSFIGFVGLGATTLMPFIIGGLMDEYGFSKEMIGWVASSNILGLWVGGVIATLLIGKVNVPTVVRVGLLGLLLFDFGSIFVATPTPMLIIRFVSGIFGGLAYTGAMAIFSGLKDSIKAFGMYVIVFTLGTGVLLIIQPFLIKKFGTVSTFAALAVLNLIAFSVSFIIDRMAITIKRKDISIKRLLAQRPILYILISYFMMMLAGGVIWTYLERIAIEAGLSSGFVGFAFGVGSVFSFIGGLIVMWLSKKGITRTPVIYATIAMGVGTILLLWAHIPALFFVCIALYGGAWAMAIPYHQQLQTGFDPEGRVVSLGAMLNMGGRAVGPALAAMLLGSSAFINVVWISMVALFFSLVLVILVINRQKSE